MQTAQRVLTRRQRAADAALAVLVAVIGQVQLHVPSSDRIGDGPLWLDVAVMALSTLPLAVRRIRPILVVLVVFGAHIVPALFVSHTMTFWSSILPMALALYTAARFGPPEHVLHLLALPVVLVLVSPIHEPVLRQWDDFVFTLMLMAAAWGAGRVISRLTHQRHALDEALRRLEQQEDQRRQQVLLEERTRIAREMHDVVAHGVSVMVVQSGAARLELADTDGAARESLLAVERTGREVLAELRRTVSLLRADPSRNGAQPSPGLADVPELVTAMRTAGLAVDLEIEAGAAADAGRELTAYRVVQEALTNALRHAGTTSVQVRVGADPHLWVEVADRGRRNGTPVAPGAGGGHGLVGMQERVAMYGGRLRAGQDRDGFVVRAEIPSEPNP